MGFFDKVKKAFGSKKEDESQNSVNEEVIDEPTFTQSIEKDNGNFNDYKDDQSEDSEETHVNEEVIDEPTPDEKNRNFRYLDELVHSGVKEIVLDSDIVLDPDEESQYLNGIKLDVDDLAIDGNGHAIDALGLTRIFYCTGKNIIIKNIILKNGFTKNDGGAIHNYEGELTITESTLQQNTAKGYGGAINNWGELTITKSTLTGNTAEGSGGAICNVGGVLTITGSTLTGNTAQDGSGGAINNWGELTITESTLNNNTAKNSDGGAIDNNEGELTITESTFNENTADNGGALYLNQKTKKYESQNCTFKNNEPDDVYEEKD